MKVLIYWGLEGFNFCSGLQNHNEQLQATPDHPGGYMNTTQSGTFSPQAGSSDWLPRPSSSKRGTYHWDEHNPLAKTGDHAIEGSHLQIHTFEGKIIRIFY